MPSQIPPAYLAWGLKERKFGRDLGAVYSVYSIFSSLKKFGWSFYNSALKSRRLFELGQHWKSYQYLFFIKLS